MPVVNPEQLEAEADELLKQANTPPPENQDSDGDDDQGHAPEPTEEGKGKKKNDPPPDQDSGDPLEGLTLENAQERIRNTQARMHQATKEAATLRRSIGELKNQVEPLTAKMRQLETELTEARKKAEQPPATDSADKDYQDLESLKDAYPTIINPLLNQLKTLKGLVQGVTAEVDSVKKGVSKTAEDQRLKDERDAQEAAAKAHFDAIRKVHSDLDAINASDDFQGWLSRQSSLIQRAAEEGDANEVIEVLDRYKAAVGKTRKLQEAEEESDPSTPRSRKQPSTKKPKFTRAQIAAMSPQEFSEKEAEIDAAVVAGEIA